MGTVVSDRDSGGAGNEGTVLSGACGAAGSDPAIFERLWLLIDGAADGAANMSVDEAILLTTEEPVLRLYGWSEPTVSFGCLLGWMDAGRVAGPVRPLVRRWTGGGIVEHGDDWTYSLIIPERARQPHWSPAESYRLIHRAIAVALDTCGVAAALHGCTTAPPASECFANPVTDDVMRAGKKIGGAAQRRCRHGILHQGSLQQVAVPRGFGEVLATTLSRSVRPIPGLDDTTRARAARLRADKYATEAWLQRR